MLRYPAPRAATKAAPIASVLSARRSTSRVGSRIWVAEQSRQRARRGVTVTGVRPDAPHGAGKAGPERAQHTLTPRARHLPGQQGLLGPLEAHHDDHSARLHS